MGNSVRNCCTSSHHDVMETSRTMTTLSSGINPFDKYGPTKIMSGLKSSMQIKSTRKLSEEAEHRFNITTDPISKYYKIGKVIGHGKYGLVQEAVSISNPDYIVAVKVIKIRKIKSNFESVMKEIQMLKEVSHPNIVKIYQIFKDQKKLYLVMEYVKGRELFDYIIQRGCLSEAESSVIIEQLLKIVKYLNSINI